MGVSISRLRKDVNEIHKALGETIALYPDNAVEITKKVNEIISMFRDSELYILNESNLSEIGMERLTKILEDAKRINAEYEIFLKMVSLSRID
jgi:hypothetical protein